MTHLSACNSSQTSSTPGLIFILFLDYSRVDGVRLAPAESVHDIFLSGYIISYGH